MLRCPFCQIVLTDEESNSKTCPLCEEEIQRETPDVSDVANSSPSSRVGRRVLWGGVAFLLLVVGVLAGFVIRPFVDDRMETKGRLDFLAEETKSKSTTQVTPKDVDEHQPRVKELETLLAKMVQERDLQTKAARNAKEAHATATEQTKQLESLNEKLKKELDLSQEQIARLKAAAADRDKRIQKFAGETRQEHTPLNRQTMFFRIQTANNAEWADLRVKTNGGQIIGYRMKPVGRGGHQFALRRLKIGDILEWEYCYQDGDGQKQTGFNWKETFRGVNGTK
ncbi:MAG: hypothetical protein ACFCD0_06745 [Gemmataceae bacterium]